MHTSDRCPADQKRSSCLDVVHVDRPEQWRHTGGATVPVIDEIMMRWGRWKKYSVLTPAILKMLIHSHAAADSSSDATHSGVSPCFPSSSTSQPLPIRRLKMSGCLFRTAQCTCNTNFTVYHRGSTALFTYRPITPSIDACFPEAIGNNLQCSMNV